MLRRTLHEIGGYRIGPLLAVCAAVAVLLTASCRVPGARPDASRPRLSALEVTGGGALFPSFSADVRHYSVRCADGTRLRVAARAEDAAHRLTLLHNERTATGTVEDSVTVNDDHDVVVEVGDGSAAVRYTVHCIPTGFPDIVIEKRAAGVSDGLLLMTPGVRRSDPPKSFLAIIDNNGVARWVRTPDERARNFRRHPDGRYSFSERGPDGTEPTVILNARFEPDRDRLARRCPAAGAHRRPRFPADRRRQLPADGLLPECARLQRLRVRRRAVLGAGRIRRPTP